MAAAMDTFHLFLSYTLPLASLSQWPGLYLWTEALVPIFYLVLSRGKRMNKVSHRSCSCIWEILSFHLKTCRWMMWWAWFVWDHIIRKCQNWLSVLLFGTQTLDFLTLVETWAWLSISYWGSFPTQCSQSFWVVGITALCLLVRKAQLWEGWFCLGSHNPKLAELGLGLRSAKKLA